MNIEDVLWSKMMKAKMNMRTRKQMTVGRTAPKASANSPEDRTPISPISPMSARRLPAKTEPTP